MKISTKSITHSAIIASLYVVLTYISGLFGLSSGAVQIRISEALTVLPYFTPSAIPGLFIGCILDNILTGSTALDIIFGSLATLLGALGTYLLRKKSIYLAPLPPIVSNMVIIPIVLIFAGVEAPIWYLSLTIGIGEFICCGVFGIVLLKTLSKRENILK